MDVLNKFKSTLQSSVSSTVFSTVSTIKDVLPGNPVTREYEVGDHIASAGPGLLWKVFSGIKKSTRQPAAVFVLEKSSLESKYPGSERRAERDRILDQFKKSISQLTRLRHPQILTVQFPLEESRDCLAFATEPVFASLSNLLGQHENLPSPVPVQIRDYKMFDVEIKYGLLQLCEGLSFLHDSVKLIHHNLNPDSIILNEAGAWKIFGFDFALSNMSEANEPAKWKCSTNLMESCEDLMPDLDFLAPEYAIEDDDILSPATDMFSLGMLAFTLHNSKPLFTNSGSWNNYRRNCTELKNLRESNLQLIPHELRDTLKLLLHATPGLRPTASECAKVAYFDDVGVRTLANLDAQFQWDNLQKSQFYKGLPQVLPRLPHRVSVHRVVPCLAKEFVNPHMVPFVLPSVLTIAEEASQKDFVNFILPSLKPVLKLTDPIQILLIFMQRMDMLLSKTPPADVKSDVLPMIYRALESDTAQIQELCLSIIPGFAGLLDFNAIKTALLPRIKRLILNTSLLSVRVNGLICIGKLLSHLDKWMVTDEILPLLQQVPSREPAVIMACIGILKLTVSDAKLALSKEIVANKVLPYLFPLSIENGLSVVQYSAVMTLIRELIDRVETEHKAKLEQLSSIQNEQRSALQINSSDSSQLKSGQQSSNSTTKNSELDQVFNGLGLGSYVSSPPVNNTNTSGNLSLSDKQKLLKDSEIATKLASQPQLKPHKTMATKSSNQTKDLTATLMEANVNQMKTSQTFSNFNLQQSTSWRPQQHTSTMQQLPIPQQQQFSMMQPQQQQQHQKRPDLSAFDSLLTMNTNSNRTPMNSMMGQQQQLNSNSNWGMTQQNLQQQQPWLRPQQPSVVKSLTENDISDLLS